MRYLSFLLLSLFFWTCKNTTSNSDVVRYSNEPASPDALFKRVPKEQTGITFENSINEKVEFNGLDYDYLYLGGGAAVGDFNNDGLQDLYFSCSMGTNKLYLNKGNLQFEDVTEKAGVAAKEGIKTGITLVDINADGLLDIYQCRSGTKPSERSNLLFINKGNLVFEESAAQYGLLDQCATNSANFFDMDNDGDLDVYLINHPINFKTVNSLRLQQDTKGGVHRITTPEDAYESDRLYVNNGNNTFSDISKQAGIINRAFGLSTCVSDFNNDGYKDIYVCCDYAEPDIIYINNKNGTFSNQIDTYMRHFTNNSMGSEIADINNDGFPDIASLDMASEEPYYQKILMTSMRKDRYAALVKYGYGKQIMRNMLHINNGNGTYSDIGQLAGIATTDWSWAVLMADYDNDGWKDMYVTNGFYRDLTNLDYVHFTLDSIRKSSAITTQEKLDAYYKLIPIHKVHNYMFRNKTDLTFEDVSMNWGFNDKTHSNGAAYADLDNDGDLDMVVNNQNDYAYVYQNQAREKNQNNYLQLSFEGMKNNPQGIGAKALLRNGTNIQYQDLTPTRGFFSSVQAILHFGLGKESTIDEIQITWSDGKIQSLKNVTANQHLVLHYSEATVGKFAPMVAPSTPLFKEVTGTMGLDFVHQENDFDDFNREFLLPHKFSTQGPHLSTGDANGDGLMDFYIGGALNQTGALYLQNSNGSFKRNAVATWEADKACEDIGSLFFDADGDKDLDLYVVSGGNELPNGVGNYQDRLYINDGKGNYTKSADALPTLHNSEANVRAFDYDSDGDLDLFLGGRVTPERYPTTPPSVLLQNSGGKFKDVTSQVAPTFANVGMVSDLTFADIDGDQKAELIVVGEFMPISIFKYDGTVFKNITDASNLNATGGWWNTISTGDFDHDGDLDLVVGNEGTNTRLRASEKEPINIFAKDFDNNGSIDPLIACYIQGKLCPLPQKDELLKQLPSLKKKFLRYHSYASSTMKDIYSESDLNSGIHFQTHTLASCYFENQGGKFVMRPLPIPAQISITHGILSQDFNQDGNLDILLVGNSNYAEVETGPYDAGNGCLLLGDGKGNFSFQRNLNTGFWAMKQARDLAVIPLANKKNLYLVANNNDKLQAFLK